MLRKIRRLLSWAGQRRRKILMACVVMVVSFAIAVPLMILCIAEPLSRTQAWSEYRAGVAAYNDPGWQQRPESGFRSYFATVDDPVEYVLVSNITRTIPQLDGQWKRFNQCSNRFLNQGWHLLDDHGAVAKYMAHRFDPLHAELPALGGAWEILISENADAVQPWLINSLDPAQPGAGVTRILDSTSEQKRPDAARWTLVMDYEVPRGMEVSGVHWRLTPAEEYAGLPRQHRTWTHHINDQGYRGRINASKSVQAPDVRVLFIGDSMTFGWGVAEHETLPRVVEANLIHSGIPVRCFNFAVPGFNTRQEFYRLAAIAEVFEPDAIVIGYCINDAEPPFSLRVPNPERYYRYVPLDSWFLERCRKPVRSIAMATYRRANNMVASVGLDWPWLRDIPMERFWLPDRGHIGTPNLLNGWNNGPKKREAKLALQDLVTFCHDRDVPVIGCLIPAINGSFEENEFHVIRSDVAAWAKEFELPFEDMHPILASVSDWRQLRVWEKDGHPNATALRMIGERVAAALRLKLPRR